MKTRTFSEWMNLAVHCQANVAGLLDGDLTPGYGFSFETALRNERRNVEWALACGVPAGAAHSGWQGPRSL
jgi:hypothetical protein